MKLRKLTLTACLTAAALCVYVLECQIPPLTAIPGIKLGLSNVFTLFTMYAVGPIWAFALFVLRVTLGGFLTGQVSAMLYGFAGGILAYFAMLGGKKLLPEKQMWVVSVFAALCHNLGQILMAIIVTGTKSIAVYFPVLAISAIVTGAFTGVCAQLLYTRKSLRKIFGKDGGKA